MNSSHENSFSDKWQTVVPGFVLLSLCCLALIGCGSDGFTSPVTGAPISGKLLSGTLPVAKAHVYLMAVAATGYGKPSVSLLDAGSTHAQDSAGAYVVTAEDGSFTIPGYYRCGAETSLYVYTRGGDSGMGENSAATELAAIGPCPRAKADVPSVVVDEVTTAAMSFALAGFANDALHIASSGSPLALVGVANAFVNASNLAPTTTGLAPASLPSGSATVPQATIDTLANILFSCIHSTGDHSPACQSLLDTGSTRPSSDTASAMIAIAHSPASAVSTLFPQQSPAPPFTPYLSAAPNDFSLGLVFSGGGINMTNGMAVDAMGNVWSTNNSYSLTEISSAGVFLSGANGYVTDAYTPGPIAIDLNDNVWIGNGAHTLNGSGSLFELSSDGTVLSGANGYGYGLLRTPEGLAIDANNNIWVTDTASNNVVEFSNSGQVLSGTKGFTGGGISNPYQLAITPSGNVWLTNSTVYSISKLSRSGEPLTPSTGVAGTGFFGGTSLAIDRQNNVWAATVGAGAQVSKISPDGVILSGSGYATHAMQAANGAGVTVAVDGDDNVWTPAGSSNVIELSNAGVTLSGSGGYGGGIALGPTYMVIDGSGDIWVSSATFTPSGVRGAPGVITWRITEMIGITAPVVTPIAAGVKLNMLGVRP
jgi:sugar lactone lactonase YvrE